jgi:hypothetical protein
MKAPPKPGLPKRVCSCGHSDQWHGQTAATISRGYVSYDGAACHHPQCSCTYARFVGVRL